MDITVGMCAGRLWICAAAPVVLLMLPARAAPQSVFADGFESGDTCAWSTTVSLDPCDGLDNDCDGSIDEEAGCYDSIDCTTDWCDGLAGCIFDPDNQFCDDAISCTVNICDQVLGCVWSIDPSYCFIDSECVPAGPNPLHPNCQSCDPGLSQTGWTLLTGIPCDDDNACTIYDNCDEGICVGEGSPCPPPDPGCPQGYSCIELAGAYTCVCI